MTFRSHRYGDFRYQKFEINRCCGEQYKKNAIAQVKECSFALVN